MKVAVFGGSFNPPHVGHVLAVTLVLSTEDVDRVLVVPTFRHPFAKDLAPFHDRVAMCEKAVAWLPGVEVSRVEEELGGDSWTVRTLTHLKASHPDWTMRWVMGADLLAEVPRWHAFDRICELAPPLVLGRSGVESKEAPPALLPSVSSTEIRTALSEGDEDRVRALVPRKVLDYIRTQRLYRTPTPPPHV